MSVIEESKVRLGESGEQAKGVSLLVLLLNHAVHNVKGACLEPRERELALARQ